MKRQRKQPGIRACGTHPPPGPCHAEARQRTAHATTVPPACEVWIRLQPSGMPDAGRLNASAANHHECHPRRPLARHTGHPETDATHGPGRCRTRTSCHGTHGAESRATSRTSYTGRFCGQRDYLMPATPFCPTEIAHGPRHSPACETAPPKRRRHTLKASGAPPGSGTGTIPARSMPGPGGHHLRPGRPPPSRGPAAGSPRFQDRLLSARPNRRR